VSQFFDYDYVYHSRPRGRDDRFFELVKAMAVAMAGRCQEGLLPPDKFAEEVVGTSAWVMSEFLIRNGERNRPLSAEEQAKEIKRLMESVKQ